MRTRWPRERAAALALEVRSGRMIRVSKDPHLDEESRAMLASGRANASVALFLESVLAIRGEERPGEALAGVMLEGEPPAAMQDDALARALEAIEGGRGPAIPVQSPTYPELSRMPPVLADAIREAEGRESWKSGSQGVSRLPLREADGVTAAVWRIPAGVAAPMHAHRAREFTLCLAGKFCDAGGSYRPGDVVYADPSIVHQPTASEDGPVFLLAITMPPDA